MPEFKGTPGPWVFDNYESLRQASGGSVTLRGTTTLSSGPSESLEEARANTRLCAAAPDLLHVVQALLSAIKPDETGQVCLSDLELVEDEARAALAKALGQ